MLRVTDALTWRSAYAFASFPQPRGVIHGPATAVAALYRTDRTAEGPGGRGCMEHPGPGAGRGRLHRGFGLAQPGPVHHRPGRDHRVPAPQVGPRTRLRAAQGPVVVP